MIIFDYGRTKIDSFADQFQKQSKRINGPADDMRGSENPVTRFLIDPEPN